MTIMITCPNCGKKYPSPIQMDQQSFQSAIIENNDMECPYCKRNESISKKDMSYE